MLREKINTIFLVLKLYINRNRYILNNPNCKTTKNTVNLYYWVKGNENNLGDFLSKVVVEYMLGLKNISPNKYVKKTKNLFAIGSIIDGSYASGTIWGSGYIWQPKNRNILKRFRNLDVRAVRGPKTKEKLITMGFSSTSVYGDPAIIMPLIYKPKTTKPKREYSIVKHYIDETPCENVINILTDDYKGFIDEIVASEKVISSSLHGIILAEAYGIPAVLYMPECLKHTMFKYEDYYYGTGRYDFPIAYDIETALGITPIAPPDFKEQRKALMEAFPYDLWE